MTAPDRPPAGPSPDGPPPGPRTLVLSRPTTPNPTNPDPDPVTNPQNPRPRSAVWPYAAIGLTAGCVLAVLGLLWVIHASVTR